MVYTGKPSRACATCKKRRIKCDEGRPSCGQCVKSKRECTGWKTEAELMFRDETSVTAKRATKKHARGSLPSPTLSTSSSSKDSEDWGGELPIIPIDEGRYSHRPLLDNNLDFNEIVERQHHNSLWYVGKVMSPNPALASNLHEQAKAYFFNHFTLFGVHHAFHLYDMMSDMYKKAQPDDPIRATTDAVSLVTLSRKRGQDMALREAARAYANAVRQVAAAVADPDRVKADETLLSIILLGFTETMDTSTVSHNGLIPSFTLNSDEKGIMRFHHAWGAHASGAELIANSRGFKDLMRSPNSVHLALFVRLQTIHKQMFIAQPIENLEELWEPMDAIKNKAPMISGHITLGTIGLKIPAIRHRGLHLCRKPMEPGLGLELSTLLADVYAVDTELRMWYEGRKSLNHIHIAGYYVEPMSQEMEHELVWPGPVYTFDELLLSNATNLHRVYRLFLQALIFNILERLVAPDQLQTHPEFLACRKMIDEIVNEVCGTVPYGMGYLQRVPLSPTPHTSPLGTFVTPELIPDFVQRHHEQELLSPTTSTFDVNMYPDNYSDNAVKTLYVPPMDSHRTHGAEDGPAIGAWYLSWPLYVSYCITSVSRQQKDWLRGRLRYISDKFGVAQALVYSKSDRDTYVPGKKRRFMPLDFPPPPWEPLQ